MVKACFHYWENNEQLSLKFDANTTLSEFLGTTLCQVSEFYKDKESATERRLKVAIGCMDSMSLMTELQWCRMMKWMMNTCFKQLKLKGFSDQSPGELIEFSTALLNASLGHSNPSMTRILCGQGLVMKKPILTSFSPFILQALSEREDKAGIIADKKLAKVLSAMAPRHGVRGFESFMSNKGKGLQIENELGL